MADATRNLQIVISARDEAAKVLDSFKSRLTDLNKDVKAAAIGMSAVGAGTLLLGKSFIKAAGDMEATKTAFNVLIGNADEAKQTLDELFTLESKTPFTLESVLTESKKLLAMGTASDDLTQTLTMLGDVAAGVGFEKLPQLTLAFGQIQAKGRLMGTELRQLTEAGFNLADAMGISNEKLDELVEDKAVKFEDVRAAFESVTSEGGRFSGMMAQLAETTPGKLSTLESDIYKLKVALGEALLPAVSDLIAAITPLIQQFAGWARDNPELVTWLVGIGLALGGIGTAILIAGPLISGLSGIFTLLGGAITFVSWIIGGIIAVIGGPLTLAILAIGALVALFALAWKNNWGGIRDKVQAVVDWFKNTALPGIKDFFGSIRSAVESFVSHWVGKFNQVKDTVQGLINKIGDLINKARELASGAFSSVKGALGFQHGGFVDAPGHQAVPAILHGGERIIPRNGADVNGGGGSPNITIQITGSFNLDSDSRVQELADKISKVLGRQSELASYGVGY